MKKYIFFINILMLVLFVSCSSDDDNGTPFIPTVSDFTFNLNGTDYSFDSYTLEADPTVPTLRRVTLDFNNSEDISERIRFWVLASETGEIGQFVYTVNDINYQSNPGLDDNFRNTVVTVNNENQLTGTFEITINDTFGDPLYVFTNGAFNLTN